MGNHTQRHTRARVRAHIHAHTHARALASARECTPAMTNCTHPSNCCSARHTAHKNKIQNRRVQTLIDYNNPNKASNNCPFG